LRMSADWHDWALCDYDLHADNSSSVSISVEVHSGTLSCKGHTIDSLSVVFADRSQTLAWCVAGTGSNRELRRKHRHRLRALFSATILDPSYWDGQAWTFPKERPYYGPKELRQYALGFVSIHGGHVVAHTLSSIRDSVKLSETFSADAAVRAIFAVLSTSTLHHEPSAAVFDAAQFIASAFAVRKPSPEWDSLLVSSDEYLQAENRPQSFNESPLKEIWPSYNKYSDVKWIDLLHFEQQYVRLLLSSERARTYFATHNGGLVSDPQSSS
jgi:hypothetical protein